MAQGRLFSSKYVCVYIHTLPLEDSQSIMHLSLLARIAKQSYKKSPSIPLSTKTAKYICPRKE
jgi:hypothetical protein